MTLPLVHAHGTVTPRALTIHQPWAHAIIYGQPAKDVENRTWPTGYRGRLYVHASMTDDDAAPGSAWAAGNAWHQHAHGAIIGYVTLDEVTLGPQAILASPWAEAGKWHWHLSDPVALSRPLPIRGRLSLWRLPDWALAALQELEA